jgi:hypothetical protein
MPTEHSLLARARHLVGRRKQHRCCGVYLAPDQGVTGRTHVVRCARLIGQLKASHGVLISIAKPCPGQRAGTPGPLRAA